MGPVGRWHDGEGNFRQEREGGIGICWCECEECFIDKNSTRWLTKCETDVPPCGIEEPPSTRKEVKPVLNISIESKGEIVSKVDRNEDIIKIIIIIINELSAIYKQVLQPEKESLNQSLTEHLT